MHVRSPVRIDGVPISKEDAKEQEDRWIKHEQERQKKKAEATAKSPNAASEADSTATLSDPGQPSLITQMAEPRFISEAYFLDFKFEAGNYYLVGKEKFDGRDVVVIEYYPSHMFDDDPSEESPNNSEKKKPPKPPSEKEVRL